MSTYYNIELKDINVDLTTKQINNNIYNNLKENLKKIYEGKTYRNYGIITKIYKITNKKKGYIIKEDSDCSVRYKIDFQCKLCNPLPNTYIIGEIESINYKIIELFSGPNKIIKIIVSPEYMNPDLFKFDSKQNLIYDNKKNKIKIEKGIHLKIKIIGNVFKIDYVFVFGSIEDLANEEEIKLFYEESINDIK